MAELTDYLLREFKIEVLPNAHEDDMACITVGALLRLATLALSATGAEDAERIAWEAPEGLGIVRFVSDRRYRLFSPKIRAWYKPYRCSQCAARSLKDSQPPTTP